ncbi:hypothetical protein EL22_26145 [Halostagnicola sp. A56]|nr:hypothetical protein EL22_26145 [Halostagnicola sp. A56]
MLMTLQIIVAPVGVLPASDCRNRLLKARTKRTRIQRPVTDGETETVRIGSPRPTTLGTKWRTAARDRHATVRTRIVISTLDLRDDVRGIRSDRAHRSDAATIVLTLSISEYVGIGYVIGVEYVILVKYVVGVEYASQPNETFVLLGICVRSPVALGKRDAQFVGDGAVHVELLGIPTECWLANDWIPFVCVLEEVVADRFGFDRRMHLKFTQVHEEFT